MTSKIQVACAALLLAGCSQSAPPSGEVTFRAVCKIAPVSFYVIPAPAYETPLQRWKRTKENYHAASHASQALFNEISDCYPSSETWPYLDAYNAAEKALEEAHCGRVCIPDKTP